MRQKTSLFSVNIVSSIYLTKRPKKELSKLMLLNSFAKIVSSTLFDKDPFYHRMLDLNLQTFYHRLYFIFL